jgi:hypothetical protein
LRKYSPQNCILYMDKNTLDQFQGINYENLFLVFKASDFGFHRFSFSLQIFQVTLQLSNLLFPAEKAPL